jgi:bifunctional non-homologous end joining protein LigD
MPAIISPQLASRRHAPPVGDRWLHEIEFDGYRTIAYVEQGQARLITRNGLDWTGYYGHLGEAFRDLGCRQTILDGEVVVQDAAGVRSGAGRSSSCRRARTASCAIRPGRRASRLWTTG